MSIHVVRRTLRILGALGCLLLPTVVSGQTVFNPRTLTFTKSVDHSAQLADGSNILTGYRDKTYLKGAAQPLMTVDLCKPVPAADGTITIVTTSSPCPTGGLLFGTPLVVNTTYEVRITAYGPGGESGVSAPSNPFALLGSPQPISGSPVVVP